MGTASESSRGGALQSGSVDAVVTDPPYGIDFESGGQKGVSRAVLRGIRNDKMPYIWWLPFVADALRDGGCLACFTRWDVQETFVRAIALTGMTVRSVIVWDKGAHGMGNLRQQFAPSHESIIFATKGAFSFPGKRPSDVMRAQKVPASRLSHPNEKPVELIEDLVKDVCPVGGTVLDPFMGSGSTGVACARAGMRFVGVELDEDYFDLSRRRIEEAYGSR